MTDTSLKYTLDTKLKFDELFGHLNKVTIVRPISTEMFEKYCKIEHPNNFHEMTINNMLIVKFAATKKIYDGYEVWIFDKENLDLRNLIILGMPLKSFVAKNNINFTF
jgi:hypothetical protein